MVGNNSFSKMYVYAKCYVQCYRMQSVIKVLIVWSWQRHVLSLCIHNMCNKTLHMCIHVYILEAVTPPVFMAWLWAWKLSNCETLFAGSEMSQQ